MGPTSHAGRIAALSVAAVTVIGGATAIGSMAHAEPSITCTPVKVVAVPGTWETNPGADPNTAVGMLRGVTDRLQQRFGDRISSYYVPYQATAFNEGVTYADSEKSGVDATRKAMTEIARSCPGTKFVGVGYSQGADVNGDVAAAIGAGRGPVPAGDYIAGGSLADPQTGTRGEVNLGVRQPRTQGILGPRKSGYGALNGKVAVACLKGDLYCATPKRDKLIRALGAVGGNLGWSTIQSSAERDLAAKSGKNSTEKAPDLGALPGEVQNLARQATGGDTTGAARTANDLAGQITTVQELVRTVAKPALVKALLNAPKGSQSHAAGKVLQVLSRTDLTGLAADLRQASSAASRNDLGALASAATGAASKIAPLAKLSPGDLAKASTVIAALQPTSVFAQARNLAGITKIDYAGLLRNAKALPRNVRNGDTRAVYRSLVAVEDRLMPLAKMANRVDFKAIGAALALSPDPNVKALGHALVILDRVDWVRVTRDLRVIQSRLAKIDPQHLPAIDRNHPVKSLNDIFGVDLLSLVPPVTDLAQHGLDVAGIKLPDGSVKQLVKSSLNPREVIRQGVEIAVFYQSQVHNKYGSEPVDDTGRPAVATLADWLSGRIAAA